MTVYHCTFRGTIQAGSIGEIFSHSLGIQSASSEQQVAQDIKDTWQANWMIGGAQLASMFPTTVIYQEVTCARVIDPMVPDLGAAYHEPFNPPLAGTSGQLPLPAQCAFAVSLTAGKRPNGQPMKGRFYLPTPTTGIVAADGMVPTSTRDAIADHLLNILNELMALGHWPSIWSRTVEDLVNVVDQVRVGNKVDTIRSRRNAQPELYAVRTLTGPQ